MKMTKKKWALVAICAVVAIGAVSCYAKAGKIKPTVTAQPLGRGELVSRLSLSGNVSNDGLDQYILSGDSEVAEVLVNVGDAVSAGDPLVRFDHTEAMNAYKKAAISYETKRLQLDETQRKYFKLQEDIQDQKDDIEWFKKKKDEYERSTDPEEMKKYEDYFSRWKNAKDKLKSMEESVMSDEAIKIEQLAFEQAKMDMDEAELAVSRLPKDLVALHDGVVETVNVAQYNKAMRGTKAVVIRTSQANTVSFQVGRFDVARLALGQKASVTIGGKAYAGTVSEIDPVATSDSKLGAKVTLDDPTGVIPGMDADLEIVTYQTENALLLPIEAVKTDRTGDYCYQLVPAEGADAAAGLYTPKKIYIKTGASSTVELEVLEGLEEGAMVATNPPTDIDAMAAVNILAQ